MELELPSDIAEALRSLTAEDRRVVFLRFGFDRGVPRTLAETAALVGCSRDQARRAELNAMEGLKSRTCLRSALAEALQIG
jgi:RNA polymerase primary sigma factor